MAVYVVGHKNPDTDSVTAAIAYAAVCEGKQNGSGKQHQPRRKR